MADIDQTNKINNWISDEIKRGVNPEALKSKLTEYGYDPNLVDSFLVKSAVTSKPVQYSNTTPPEQPSKVQVNSQGNSVNNSIFEKMGLFDKTRTLFLDPKRFFDVMPRSGGYGEPYGFFLMFTILSTILSYGTNYDSLSNAIPPAYRIYIVYIVAGSFVVGLLSPFVSAFFLNILFKLFGGKGTYESTFRVICYLAAIGIVSWIPIVGGLVGLYGAYIAIVGYSKVHQISGGRVLLAILVPIIVLAVIGSLMAYSWITQIQRGVALNTNEAILRNYAGTGVPASGITGNLLKLVLS